MVDDGDHLANWAQSQLGTDRFTPTTEFYAELIRLDREAAKLRLKISKESIGHTGWSARKRLNQFEEQYIELYDELITARIAIETHQPYQFECVDQPFSSDHQNEFLDCRKRVLDQVNASFRELDRTRSLLSAKQSESVSRNNMAISTLILLASALTLIVSVLL